MTTAATAPHFLLLANSEGDLVAVRFPSVDAARAWEDEHEEEVEVNGCVRIVSKAEALRGF